MKVIIASFLFETNIGGGAAVVVNQLAQSLIRANYEVVVLTTWPGSHVKIENGDEVKVIRLPASNLYWIADKDQQPAYKKVIWQLIDVWNPLIYRMTRDILLNEKPDILHSHKLRGLSPSIWSAASSAGVKKIVHTLHDFELLSPEGLLMGRVGRLAKEQSLIMRPYQSIRRHLSRLVHHVAAPSRFVSELHTKMGFFPLAKSWVIPNTHGLDSGKSNNDHLTSRPLSDSTKCTQFLYIGRLDKAKGIDLLCQVFSRAANQDHNLSLKVAGWGPLDEFLREKYKRQNNIQFIGPVFGDQKAEVFGSSDVVIAPSLAPESFGIVIAEAYAYGLPVIASRIGAYPEIVKNGKTGFLVEPGSAEELYSAILDISANKNQLKAMSVNCFAEAQKFTLEKFASNYLHIYEGRT